MIATITQVLELALARLSYTITTFVPPLLAGLIILLVSVLMARLSRWMLNRLFKGTAVDRFLQRSGISAIFDPRGRLRATRMVSTAVYWTILLGGALTALNAFNTDLTNRMVETAVSLFPKLVTAAAILLAGIWLAQYLGRGVLVWAANEGISSCRNVASAVRAAVVFVAVVVAADHLNFARNVFLAAFILVAGGVVLAASIAFGLAARKTAERCLQPRHDEETEQAERPLWTHL